MKRLLVAVSITISLVCTGGLAFAQPSEDLKEEFIDFENLLIEGGTETPGGIIGNAREKARFESGLRLDKTFLPEVQNSTHDDALDS